MRFGPIFGAIVILLGLSHTSGGGQKDGEAASQAKKNVLNEKQIRDLIADLGDDSFAKREAADKGLAAAGRPALPLLRKAAKETTDGEVRERAERLIQLLSATAGTGVLRPEGPVFEIAISKDGQTMAVACDDKAVRLYDSKSNQLRHILKGHTARVWSVAFSPDGKKLAACSGEYKQPPGPGEVIVWDLAKGTVVSAFHSPQGLFGVTFSQDGTMLFAGGWDETIRVWDVAGGKEKGVMTGHKAAVRRVVVTPDGNSIASSSMDGTVRFWNPATLQEERHVLAHPEGVGAMTFSPDGKWLVTGSRPSARPDPGVITVWDLVTLKEKMTIRAVTRRVVGLAVSPDSTLLAMGGGLNKDFGEVKLFELATGNEKAVFKDHKEWVECVAFTPDGQWLVSGGGYTRGKPGEIRVWDVKRLAAKEE